MQLPSSQLSSQETSQNTSQETSPETTQETSQECSQETTQETTPETSQNTSQEGSQEGSQEERQLLQQIRCVTVLSMAIKCWLLSLLTHSSQICLQSVMDNTVQYYLAYLTIPVEYIQFDTLGLYPHLLRLTHSTIDYANWRRLLDIATRPTTNYIALLSLFLPPASFYTIFIQIVVNRLTKLTSADYTYLLRVLSFLPVARQYAFARFCWRV